jgi:hypothetical protein
MATQWNCTPGPANCVPNNTASNAYAAILDTPGNTLTLDNASTPSSITINTLSLQAGTLNIGAGASLNLANQPSGIIDVSSAAGLVVAGTFVVNSTTDALAQLSSVEGALTLAGQTTNVGNSLTVNNTGAVNVQQGTALTVTGDLNSSGAVQMMGASLRAGSFTNSGSVDMFFDIDRSAGSVLTSSGNFNNSGALSLGFGSNAVTIGGNFKNSGLLSFSGGSAKSGVNVMTVDGAFNNAGSLTMRLSPDIGATLIVDGLFTNSGTVTALGSGGGLNANSGFTNSGSVAISRSGLSTSNYTQTGGSTDVGFAGRLNAASYTQSGGSTTIEFGGTISTVTFKATGGTVTVNGTLDPTAVEFDAGSTLQGTGAINGNLAMGGRIIPGTLVAPGTLTINGNYEQIGSGVFDEFIGGPQSNGLLFVNGVVALDSDTSLQIVLLNGFNPLGDSLTLMDYNSLVGAFANGTSFAADGYNWTLAYGSNDIVVTAISATPEPGTLVMLGSGVLALCRYTRRKKALAKDEANR